jgi:hypothetical protein
MKVQTKSCIIGKIIFIFIASSLFISYTSIAQDYPTWVSRYTGLTDNSVDTSYWIILDHSGNTYITGVSDGDYATVKYNSNGYAVWNPPAVRYHLGTGHHNSACCIDIQKQTYDKIYITGYTYDDEYQHYQITTRAYSADGGFLWSCNYRSLYGDCAPRMLKSDVNGNIYVTGYRTSDRSKDFVTLKINSNGILSSTWPDQGDGVGVRTYDDPVASQDYALALDVSGDIVYVTGIGNFDGLFDYRMVTIAYNADGSELWNEPNNYSCDPGFNNKLRNTIAADFNNGVYVTGRDINQHLITYKLNALTGMLVWANIDYNGFGWGSSINFFSRQIGNSWAHINDIFVTGYVGGLITTLKICETSSVELWKQYNSMGQGYSLGIDNFENVFVVGTKYTSMQNMNMAVLKYNSSGTLLFSDEFNGSGNGNDYAYCVDVDLYGNPVIAGFSRSSGTNDDYTTMKYVLKNDDDGDNFKLKRPNEYELSQNYPNPFNPSTQIKYAIPQNGFVSLKVFDLLGREVCSLVNEYKEAGYYNTIFNGSNLSSGMYFYKLTCGNYTEVKKMILIK